MKKSQKAKLYTFLLFISLSGFPVSFSQPIVKTIINGLIVDSKTGKPVAGANVFLEKTTIGTITDRAGNYRIETTVYSERLVCSYIGYKTEYRSIKNGISQTININLKLSSIALDEVKIIPGRRGYKNKNNPAVELIQKVIDRKAENRKEKFNYLEYNQYEKTEFALSNVGEKFAKSNLLKKFRFIFDNIDTTKRIGNNTLPLFIMEVLSDHYYRKDPESTKEIVRAEKTVNLDKYFDNKGISSKLDYLYQNINIYDNEILFLKNKFVSPIAGSAPLFYKYFIIDTLSVNEIKCIRLFFIPRNKSDFLFQGYLYISPDNNYAVRKIDMTLNRSINMDWVQNVVVSQDFRQVGKEGWLLSKDEILIDFGIAKNKLGLFGQRTVSYKDYKINEPPDEKIFNGPAKIARFDSSANSPDFWESNRHMPLSKSETGAYTMVDSIVKIRAFRTWMGIFMTFPNDFLNLGKIELGPEDSFFSFNPVEGTKLRIGGRTTPDFSKKLTFDGYVAYGLTDKIFKYGSGLTYSLTKGTIYQFPVKSIHLSYQKDVIIPGHDLTLTEEDNLFSSFKRGIDDKYLLNKSFKAEYLNESENHFSWLLGYNFTLQSTEGNLFFNTEDYLSQTNNISNIDVSEVFLNLRYAPSESFYQRRLYRIVYPGRYPVIQLKMALGAKSIYNDYNYMRFQLNISKRIYFSILGYSDVSFEAGRILGKVPYPLLFMHRANQTYSYQVNSYNLMNFLEFVSDRYVSLNIDHCFNGFIFNKIPLIKKLKLREVVTCKVLYGGLGRIDNPDYQNDLFKFPVDSNGVPLTYTLEKQPYIEASVGIANIMKVFRVDLVKRFTYLNHPNVSDIGVRLLFELNI